MSNIEMHEYITKILYEDKPTSLYIGTNGISVIIGQKEEWVVLDKDDVRKLAEHISGKKKVFDNFTIKVSKDEVLISQLNHTVCFKKSVISKMKI